MIESGHSGALAPYGPGLAPEELKDRIVAFVRLASLEMTPHDRGIGQALAGRLPAGTSIYVTHTPNASVGDVAAAACEIESRGFRACPHIVARRIPNERSLNAALATMKECGIARAMLVAGDLSSPAGDFASSLDILATGALARAGFTTLGVAGHPEGHKRIGSMSLWAALREKQEYAESTGSHIHIVSQFGFDPLAIGTWVRQLDEHGITLPVHVGIAGPASLRTLIRFAMLCGIGASLNSLMASLSALTNVRQLVTSVDEMICQLARAWEGNFARRVVKPHFFSFGGVAATADWLHAVAGGNFHLVSNTSRVIIGNS
ncbi:MAG TPA: methylenetetrahydrofolate reductase [Steroidobacteraceae bacterium]|nr:methylenetetrahydrofolate reductase [Steroidobacteraceae bacterium]